MNRCNIVNYKCHSSFQLFREIVRSACKCSEQLGIHRQVLELNRIYSFDGATYVPHRSLLNTVKFCNLLRDQRCRHVSLQVRTFTCKNHSKKPLDIILHQCCTRYHGWLSTEQVIQFKRCLIIVQKSIALKSAALTSCPSLMPSYRTDSTDTLTFTVSSKKIVLDSMDGPKP